MRRGRKSSWKDWVHHWYSPIHTVQWPVQISIMPGVLRWFTPGKTLPVFLLVLLAKLLSAPCFLHSKVGTAAMSEENNRTAGLPPHLLPSVVRAGGPHSHKFAMPQSVFITWHSTASLQMWTSALTEEQLYSTVRIFPMVLASYDLDLLWINYLDEQEQTQSAEWCLWLR